MFDQVKKLLGRSNEVNSPAFEKGNFSAHSPIHSIEDGFIFSKDGMVYRGYRVAEPYFEETDEDGYKKQAEAVALSIADLPSGSCWHRFSVFHSVYFDERSKDYELDYSKFFDFQRKQHLLTRPILAYESYLYIGMTADPKVGKVKRNAFNTGFSIRLGNSMGNVESVIAKYDAIASRVMGRLSAAGVKCTQLSSEDATKIFYKYFNVDFKRSSGEGIKHDFLNKHPYYQAGSKLVSVISYDGQVRDIESSVKSEHGVTASFNHKLYHSLSIPHIVNQFVFKRDHDELLSDMDKIIGHFKGSHEDEVASTIEEYIRVLNARNDKLCEMGTNIIVYANDVKTLTVYQELATAAIRSLGNCDAREEVIEDTGNLFFSSVPGAIHQNYRTQIIPVSMAAPFLAFSGNYYDKGTFIVRGRDGRPVFIQTDPEDPEQANNWNFVGPTGGGKSFLLNGFAAHYLEMGHEMFIVDKGGSYGMLCLLFGGKRYDFEDLTKVNLNFFPTRKNAAGEYVLTSEKIIAVKSQFKIMWRYDKLGAISTSEDSVLGAIIGLFYEYVNRERVYPIMDTFIAFVKTLSGDEISRRLDVNIEISKYFDIQDFLLAISKFGSKSGESYSMVYNGSEDTQIDVDTKFALFDLRNVAKDPFMFTLFAISLMNLILEKVYGRKHIRKHVWFDECSELMKTQVGDVFRVLFREIRKENGDVATIVQLITDMSETETGRVIMDNATNKVLLDHAKATKSLPDLRESLDLTDHNFEKVLSLNKIPSEKYREFALLKDGRVEVYAFEVPEEVRSAFSSSPKDQFAIKEALKRFKSPTLALRQYVEDKAKQAQTNK